MEDTDIMPWGKYKGLKMQDVPAEYLLYLYENLLDKGSDIYQYIVDNLDTIKKQCATARRNK